MAFLPALAPTPTAIRSTRMKKREKNTKKNSRKNYRISLSNINAGRGQYSDERLSTARSTESKRREPEKNYFGFGENSISSGESRLYQSKQSEQQSFKRAKHSQTEPVLPKCPDYMVAERTKFWMEPLGLWIPLKHGKRFYEKFSSRIDLLCKDPDELMDPSPHIPRCDHSRSWSAVKLERQKFREVNRLKNEQSLQKTVERYRYMQEFWLQQNNNTKEALHSTSSQTRIKNFRKMAGECFNPLSELQRLERLQERRQQWENSWRTGDERRNAKSKKKTKGCVFPKITVTDYDMDTRTQLGQFVDKTTEHIKEMTHGFVSADVARTEHVIYGTSRRSSYVYNDEGYDVLCTPVECSCQLEGNLDVAHNDEVAFETRKAFLVDEPRQDMPASESVAVKRHIPRVGVQQRVLDPVGKIPRRLDPVQRKPVDYTKSEKHVDIRHFYHHAPNLVPKASNVGNGKQTILKKSTECDKEDPSSPASLSTSSRTGCDTSPSVNELISVSMANLAHGKQLLGSNIREADNTVHLMAHLVPVPLGMTSGKIPDENIRASSVFDVYHEPNQARLYNRKKDLNGGAWIPKAHDLDSYLEIDLGHVVTIQQVATQGNPASAVKQDRHKRWVTKFSLEFSQDGKHWEEYEESGSLKVFTGNSDSDTAVLNSLQNPVETRFIRFKPKEWHIGIAMRVEVFGPKSLPETVENSELETVAQEVPQQSFDFIETDNKAFQDGPKEHEPIFSEKNSYAGSEKLSVVEERAVTPVAVSSAFVVLMCTRELSVKLKHSMEPKLCANRLPFRTSKARRPDAVTEQKNCDKIEPDPNTEDQRLEINRDRSSPTVEEEKEELKPKEVQQHKMDTQQDIAESEDIFEIERSKSIIRDAPVDPQGNWIRDLQRARTDGSLQRQLRREKLAEERRKKLALVNSRKTKHWSDQNKDTVESSEEIGSFLEKYCILGKPEMSIYERVFEKLDGDEDGFLWPEEALEALENVNKNLLIDSHLSYVFRILELCDCHAESGVGLHLFSVIAALSQRVADLNDKMKLLISKCDFKTMDCTLLRAKLLFECYVNEHTMKISRHDLWIGLAAGGLRGANETMDDYFQEKQSFDFLDFLTYLPLFQEIHENVVDNPLTTF